MKNQVSLKISTEKIAIICRKMIFFNIGPQKKIPTFYIFPENQDYSQKWVPKISPFSRKIVFFPNQVVREKNLIFQEKRFLSKIGPTKNPFISKKMAFFQIDPQGNQGFPKNMSSEKRYFFQEDGHYIKQVPLEITVFFRNGYYDKSFIFGKMFCF